MFKHKKSSAKADTADGTLVQPSDWNEKHILGTVGDVITVGMASFSISGTAVNYPVQFPATGGHVGVPTRTAQGEYHIPIDVPTMAANLLPATGFGFQLFAHLSVIPKGALTTGYQFSIGQNGDAIDINLGDASWNPVNPNVECMIYVTIMAAVISA